MTSNAHSVLNTWLLSIVTILLMGVLGLMGWGLAAVVDIGKSVASQKTSVENHTEQLSELKGDVKEVKVSQGKIEIALAKLGVPQSRP